MFYISENLASFHTDVIEPMLIHFFLIITLGYFIGRYAVAKKNREIQHTLIGLIIGLVQVVVMLIPARIGTEVSIDPSTFLVMVAFGFFGRIAGFITLAITLTTYFIKDSSIFWLGLVPYIFAAIVPYYLTPYLRKRNRKLHYFLVYLLTALVNSLLLFATEITKQDARDNIWITLLTFFILLPTLGLIISTLMYRQRVQTREHLEILNRERLQYALINAPQDMEIFALDHNFNYLVFNDFHTNRCKTLFNALPEVGKNILTMFDDQHIRTRLETKIARGLSGETFDIEVEIEGKSGLVIHDFYNPIFNNKGEVIGVTIISYEITERKQYEKNIKFYSYHDKLTGLYNRRFFDEYVDELATTKKEVLIIYSDINGLKIMNDVFGHDYGDELLKTVASAISNTFKEHAVVARTGGDEIIIVLEAANMAHARTMIKEVRGELLEKIIMGIEISVSFSEPIKAKGNNIYRALQSAEDSMYLDKQLNASRHQSNVINVLLNKIDASFVDLTINDEILALVTKFGEELKLSASEIRNLQKLTRVRIVGNVVLENGDFLLIDEHEQTHGVFRNHLMIAYRLILINKDFNLIAPDLTSLHENYDGTGVPRKLKEREIPYKARILRIVSDYFTLLATDNKTNAEVLGELTAKVGREYDPTLMKTFLHIINK